VSKSVIITEKFSQIPVIIGLNSNMLGLAGIQC